MSRYRHLQQLVLIHRVGAEHGRRHGAYGELRVLLSLGSFAKQHPRELSQRTTC